LRFDYLEPKTIEEAVSMLCQYDGKARVIAGGTDLMVQIKNKAIKPKYVIDITAIPDFDNINYDDKRGLKIGALTTIRDIETSAEIQRRYPIIHQATSQLGSVAIRNVATIGGNLCNAAPSAETAPALIGLSASVRIIGPDGEKVLPVEKFFTGPGTTVLKKGELLAEIQVPTPSPNTKSAYLKHSIRKVDLAIVSVAVVITLAPQSGECRDIRIVLGAVAPTPMRALKAEEILRGKKFDESLINESARIASAEARPITDVRASAEYRAEMVAVLTRRTINKAMAQ